MSSPEACGVFLPLSPKRQGEEGPPLAAGMSLELCPGARDHILAVLPSKGIANLVVKLFMSNPDRSDILELQADLMQRRLPDAQRDVDQLVRDLKKLGGQERAMPAANDDEANVNFIDEVDD